MCETHAGCDTSNFCRYCKCYHDAWACNYNKAGAYILFEQCKLEEFVDIGAYKDSNYLFSTKERRFDERKEACQEKGGHLAVLETEDESEALESLLDQAPKYTQKSNIIIGASSDDGENGPWFWADGTSLSRDDSRWTYRSRWTLRKIYAAAPHCVAMRPWLKINKYEWGVTSCSFYNYFICEVPSTPSSNETAVF